MIKKIKLALVLTIVGLLQVQITTAQDEFDIVRKNIVNNLKAQAKTTTEAIATLQQNQQADGSWADIQYTDDRITLWTPIRHLHQIKEYCIAINKGYNRKLDERIVAGLNYWLKAAPKSKNWWYNDIATPQALGEILMLIDEAKVSYPKTTKDALLESMKRGDPYKQTGANKLDIAMHYLYRACAAKDAVLMDAAVNQLFAPIEFSSQEGLQTDYSYFQHGKQLYLAGYGAVFLTGEYKAAAAVMNTRFALSKEKQNLLYSYLTETFLRAIRGRYSDFNIEGRSISRPNMLDKKNAVLDGYAENTAAMLALAKNIDPSGARAIDAAIARIEERQPPALGISSYHKQFYRADYTMHQRKAYSFNIRAVSVRTRRTESGNGENIFGRFLADGSTNIQRTGSEYFNIMPLWEWDKLPGITCRDYLTDQPAVVEWGEKGNMDFVGGVSDGKYGCTVYDMDYNQVAAKKAWFLFDREIVCLGTGINSTEAENITTTLNQCWLKGKVGLAKNKWLLTDTEKLDNPAWVWHDSIGYCFLQNTRAVVSAAMQKGSWKRINKGYSDEEVNGKVFKLFIDHGVKPANASYAYCVLPNVALQEMNSTVTSNIKVLANNNQVQAVANNALQMLQVCFYQPQGLSYKQLKVTVDQPCLVLVKEMNASTPEIWLADPSQKLTELTVTVQVNNKPVTRHITLPDGESRGKSLKVSF
ncbi:chondroitinase [Pedobacter sp. KBW01]|uniref:polysaccharide lyase 8 family protein n=1 Tax=Pedobacter sp. KBW01 TaxID=2153364 RepID=UPI000F59D703|nr:polysaccharide lyase 8 family protein [Pedobacter sp. KBW01]RQO79455.1 chondroitinase [Pedobacter sp. KBW01]